MNNPYGKPEGIPPKGGFKDDDPEKVNVAYMQAQRAADRSLPDGWLCNECYPEASTAAEREAQWL